MSTKKKNIFWFRRDLRIADNRGFYEACLQDEQIVPIFIFDTNILSKFKEQEDRRVQFLWESLLCLKSILEEKGGTLSFFIGKPEEIFSKIIQNNHIFSVFCNEDYEPQAIQRDKKIKTLLARENIKFNSFKDQVIFKGDQVLKKDGTPYKVFTPYKNAWLERLRPEDLKKHGIKKYPLQRSCLKDSVKIKSVKDVGFTPTDNEYLGGHKEAKKLVKKFLPKIHLYKEDRDYIFKDSNSHLSPHLRFGTISIRELVRQCYFEETEGAKVWLSELIWREFYQMILFQSPYVVKGPFQKKYDHLIWPGTQKNFTLWKKGQTGFPIIDAAMIHFSQTGQMHNRLRMVVASFLTKDLLVDWKKGEEYFSQKLFDFDLASNNGGWQWSASTGCDAQPYFRIFNPFSQSERFDKEGEFILSILTQLQDFPRKYIHSPHLAPLKIQEEANCIIGKDYPAPIVDHSKQRLLAIEMFKNLK